MAFAKAIRGLKQPKLSPRPRGGSARQRLARLSIGAKLILGVSALIVLLLAASIVSSWDAYRSQALVDDLAHQGAEQARANQVQAETVKTRMIIWQALATGDKRFWNGSDKELAVVLGLLSDLVDNTQDKQRKAKGVEVTSAVNDYSNAIDDLRRYHTYAEASKDPAGATVLANAEKVGEQMVQGVPDLAALYHDAANAAQERAKRSASLAMVLSLGLAVGSSILALICAKITIGSIRRPIVAVTAAAGALARGDLSVAIPHADERNEMGNLARAVEVFKTNAIERRRLEAEAAENRDAAEAEQKRSAAEKARIAEEQGTAMRALGAGLKRLADGDLTARLDGGFPAQFAMIRDDFNHAADRLMLAVRSVVDGANAINAGVGEIAAASDEMSQRTERQAASLEQTVAALGEITSTLSQSAEGANHARDIVAAADEDAKKGAGVVKKAVDAMDAIAKSSVEIGRIIGVIDEIAFQTNLLALNAGVEAARAGDAGRGFAVVASEVRALAQRSAEAAKEIKSLVSNSAAQVGSGVKLVADAGAVLQRIIEQVSEINRVVAQIAAGSAEQASSLQEVDRAINTMDQATRQNATMVEQSTAANHSLSQEAAQLARLVEQFRVGAGPAAGRSEAKGRSEPPAAATPIAA